MWWYNILGYNKGSISHNLSLDYITAGFIFLVANIVALKRGNSRPILIVKRTDWMIFVDYFDISIETDLSKVGKLNVHFFRIGSIPITSSVNPCIARQHL